MGQYHKAEPLFLALLGNRNALREQEHLETAVLSNTGGNYHALGDYASAIRYLSECVAIRRKELGPAHPRLALALIKLSASLSAAGRLDDAARLQAEALSIYEKVHGPWHPEIARTLVNMAATAREAGAFERAEQLLERAREVTARTGQPDKVASAEYQLGLLGLRRGRLAEAGRWMELALSVRRAGLGPRHVDTARAALAMARIELQRRNLAQARQLYSQAATVIRNSMPSNHPDRREAESLGAALGVP
jgi:tetratricopeptide (TPR) repeat protein